MESTTKLIGSIRRPNLEDMDDTLRAARQWAEIQNNQLARTGGLQAMPTDLGVEFLIVSLDEDTKVPRGEWVPKAVIDAARLIDSWVAVGSGLTPAALAQAEDPRVTIAASRKRLRDYIEHISGQLTG